MSENEDTQELISIGAELAGSAAGGALGFFAGGSCGRCSWGSGRNGIYRSSKDC